MPPALVGAPVGGQSMCLLPPSLGINGETSSGEDIKKAKKYRVPDNKENKNFKTNSGPEKSIILNYALKCCPVP